MPKVKNVDLPGIEGDGVAPKRLPEVEKAANRYVELRDERMSLLEKEIDARAVLADKMLSNNLTVYRFDDHLVEVKPGKTKVKVKTVGEPDDEDED